jgi:putative membrane protein
MRALFLFNDEDKKAIEDAIAAAETRTSAEIVPVVATASGRYDRAEDIFGILLSLVLVSLYWIYIQPSVLVDWSADLNTQAPLWPVLIVIIVGYMVGAYVATIFPSLRLPFISRGEMQEEVERRALETFQRQRIRATEGGNGVLIYLSLYEHMVHVVGDDAVNEHITAQDWQKVASIIVDGMKTRHPRQGMVNAIEHTGELLKDHFPYHEGDRNELADGLVLID